MVISLQQFLKLPRNFFFVLNPLGWILNYLTVLLYLYHRCQRSVTFSVLSQEKFEAMDIKVLGASQLSESPFYSSWLSDRLCYSSRTDQFYLENKGKYILEVWGHVDPKDEKRREGKRASVHEQERERPPAFGSSFYMFFPPLGLPYVNWANQECCLFYPRSSLWSSKLPLFYFCRLFPSLSFSHCYSGFLFPSLTT